MSPSTPCLSIRYISKIRNTTLQQYIFLVSFHVVLSNNFFPSTTILFMENIALLPEANRIYGRSQQNMAEASRIRHSRQKSPSEGPCRTRSRLGVRKPTAPAILTCTSCAKNISKLTHQPRTLSSFHYHSTENKNIKLFYNH